MQKNKFKCFIILLFVSLSACSSTQLEQHNENKVLKNDKNFLVDPSIARFMVMDDRITLLKLITTAEPEQSMNWSSKKTGAHFVFRSKRIFINSAGQGCRNYQIEMFRGLLSHQSFDHIACRDSQGDWVVSSLINKVNYSSDKPKSMF